MIIWDYEPGFKPGDIITFCKEEFEVIENHGHKGIVKERGCDNPTIINNFYWMYEDEKCVLKNREDEQ